MKTARHTLSLSIVTIVSLAAVTGLAGCKKAASDSYAPVAGEIGAVNDDLADAPETINADPYGDGWIWKMSVTDPSALDHLMDAEAYAAFCEAEEQ